MTAWKLLLEHLTDRCNTRLKDCHTVLWKDLLVAAMPCCGCLLTGVEDEWGSQVELVRRLNQGDRLFIPHGSDGMKITNKDAAKNALVLQPLLRKISGECGWELFSLPEITKKLLAASS